MFRMICFPLILCCTLIIPRNGISQDPCANKEFQYAYIKSNCEETYRCAKDPNNQNQSFGKIEKWADGATLTFCVPELNDPASGTNTGACVNNNDITECIRDAINAWIGLCPSGTLNWEWVQEGTAPCIPIKWSSNDQDFIDSRVDAAVAKAKPLCATGEIREYWGGSNTSRIWINNTEKFKRKYQNVYPCPPGAGCDTKNRTINNLCATVAHEIGHIFGLLHTGEVDQIPCESSSSDPQNDLMYAATAGGCNGPKLSINDMCMFKKLYCYGYYDVSMSYDRTYFDIFPNPAYNNLNLEFESEVFGQSIITISDMLGRTLITDMFQHQAGKNERSLSLDELTSGIYFIRLENNSYRGTKAFQLIVK